MDIYSILRSIEFYGRAIEALIGSTTHFILVYGVGFTSAF